MFMRNLDVYRTATLMKHSLKYFYIIVNEQSEGLVGCFDRIKSPNKCIMLVDNSS